MAISSRAETSQTHKRQIIPEHTRRSRLARPPSLLLPHRARCRTRRRHLSPNFEFYTIDRLPLCLGLDKHLIHPLPFRPLGLAVRVHFHFSRSAGRVIRLDIRRFVHGIQPLIVRETIRVLDFCLGSPASTLILGVDHLGGEDFTKVASVEGREFRFLHERGLKWSFVPVGAPSGELLGFPISIHLGENAEFALTSGEKLVQLVIV